MTRLIIFLIGLLIPSAKPCLKGFSWDGSPAKRGFLPGETGIQCLQSLPQLEGKLKFANKFIRSPLVSDLLSLIPEVKPFLLYSDYFLGQEKPTTYLILLQNNYEMRANGGFFGSYAVIKVSPRTVARRQNVLSSAEGDSSEVIPPEVDIRFQDIYVPDGQLVGHVDPPAPIQTAFKQGWFRLRDSDWDPDFSKGAKTIRWFFEKGNETNPDILVTLNLSTIKKILAIVGDINVPEYNITINQDNVYSLLQNQSEINFFPGSTQKKDVLTATGNALIQKLSHLEFDQYIKLVKILQNQLERGNFLVNSKNPDVQNIIEDKDWGGKIITPDCRDQGCLNDTYLLVEANLGANKANCCTDRKTTHNISQTPPHSPSTLEGEDPVPSNVEGTARSAKGVTHQVTITFTNSSPLENPSPPRFFGGNYISYLRFYIPQNATNIKVSANPTFPKTLTDYPQPLQTTARSDPEDPILQKGQILQEGKYGLSEIGFFHLTAAGTQSTVSLSYELGISSDGDTEGGSSEVIPSKKEYQFTILKQHGMENSPQEITLFNQSYTTNLENDFTVTTPLLLP